MKGYAALIEPSEFDWSEAKLSRYRRDRCARIGINCSIRTPPAAAPPGTDSFQAVPQADD
jgi:hypothetical protein